MAGVAGGLLMALAGPATQASVPPARRGTAGGLVIAGVGIGIATGAVAVPALLAAGVSATWLGLAALVALLWAFAHPHWPRMALTGVAAARLDPALRGPARLLTLTYALHAAGMVPPMVYLADLAARGRGLGVGIGAATWLVFGLAGMAGGIFSGRATDRLGGRATLRLWLLIQAVALALALPPWAGLVLPAAAASGFAAVGVTTVTLTVGREIAGLQATALWVQCTAAFAVTQTAGGLRPRRRLRRDRGKPCRGLRRRPRPSPSRPSGPPCCWHAKQSHNSALACRPTWPGALSCVAPCCLPPA